MALSDSIPIQLIDKFQVLGFLRAMEEHTEFTFEDMMSFQKDPIPTSLLKLNSDLITPAVNLFQIILEYMRVDSSDTENQFGLKERVELVEELYIQALKSYRLRDELFVQISKQTRNCPDRQELLRAWELMYVCASCMPPYSKDIGAYVSKCIDDVALDVDTDPDVLSFAFDTIRALKCSRNAGPRLTVPGHEEIEALLLHKKLTTLVFFLDGTSKEIAYDLATTVAKTVKEVARIIELSRYPNFRLFKCREVVTAFESPEPGNEEYTRLMDNNYIGDILAEFKSAEDQSTRFKLIFKKKIFLESDEAVVDPISVHLSYIQLQRDYILGNYPVGKDDATRLSALQILIEKGIVDKPELSEDWGLLLERFLPLHIAITNDKCDWESDILARYHSLEKVTKEGAKQEFLSILRSQSYGYSVFFSVRKLFDPIRVLPRKIILGINKRGVHLFHQRTKEHLLSTEVKDIAGVGITDTFVFLKMTIDGESRSFQFETKQGLDIYIALQISIRDDMLRRYRFRPNRELARIGGRFPRELLV